MLLSSVNLHLQKQEQTNKQSHIIIGVRIINLQRLNTYTMCVLITKNKKSPLVLLLGEEESKKMQQHRRHRNDHLVDVVIAYNNAACIQMEKCNYERSVKLFATAAAVYKRVLFHRRRRRRSHSNNKNVAIEESSSVVVSVDSFMRRNAGAQAINNATTGACYQQPAAETAAGVRAYTRPIQIPPISSVVLDDNDAQSCSEEDDELSGCFSSILQFNLALAYHLLGIQRQRRDLLRRAISTYESSFRFERLRHCSNNNNNNNKKDNSSSFVSYFLLAAIINNLGHVYRFTKQQNQTERHFRKLIVLLTHLVRIKLVRRTDEEYSMFFRNCAIGLSRQEGHILGACAA